jgi:hypothetical protein
MESERFLFINYSSLPLFGEVGHVDAVRIDKGLADLMALAHSIPEMREWSRLFCAIRREFRVQHGLVGAETIQDGRRGVEHGE